MLRTYLYYVATACAIVASLSSFIVAVLTLRESSLADHWYSSPYFHFALGLVFLTTAVIHIARIRQLKMLSPGKPS